MLGISSVLLHAPERCETASGPGASPLWGAPPSSAGSWPTCGRPRGPSLREVEEVTGKAVSNAYLGQLAHGKIKRPSPNVLHSLAGVLVQTPHLGHEGEPHRQGERG
jgi:hypothetical protein